jgi:hypothetical protein
MPRLPFYIGQSADDVLGVAKKTGRERLAVEFEEGCETFHFDLSAKSAKERRAKKKALEAEVVDKKIDLARIPKVRYFYADCVLTFEKTRGPTGEGALCYRLTRIETEGDDARDTG